MTRAGSRSWINRGSKLKHRLRNPYFSRRTKSGNPFGRASVRRRLLILLVAAAPLLVGGGLLFILTSDFFAIKEPVYQFSDLSPASRERVRAAVEKILSRTWMGLINQRSFFLLDSNEVQDAIRQIGEFAEVKVTKKLPHTLIVDIREKEKVFFLTRGAERAVLGKRGEVVELFVENESGSSDLSRAASSSVLISVSLDSRSGMKRIAIGEQVICPNCATLIAALDRALISLTAVSARYQIDSDQTTISAVTADGWYVKSDPIISASEQLERLTAVLKDQKYKDRRRLDYIDVRYPDRVFVKLK